MTDVATALEKLDMHDERARMQARARKMGFAFVDLDRIQIDGKVIAALDADIVRRHNVMVVKKQDTTVFLALANPNDLAAIDAVQQATRCRVVPVLALPEEIGRAISKYYG